MNLKDRFFTLCDAYSSDLDLILQSWNEIENQYSKKGRFYHNLQHLENMCKEIDDVKSQLKSIDTVLFSIYYHDIVYHTFSKLNEEKSSDWASESLKKIGVSKGQIDKVQQQILATKKHLHTADLDTNYLLDADLSVLGKEENMYNDYIKKIRKEYSIYPNFLYNPAREKVLLGLLEQNFIYKTDFFREKYELLARENIERELKLL